MRRFFTCLSTLALLLAVSGFGLLKFFNLDHLISMPSEQRFSAFVAEIQPVGQSLTAASPDLIEQGVVAATAKTPGCGDYRKWAKEIAATDLDSYEKQQALYKLIQDAVKKRCIELPVELLESKGNQ